MRGSVDPRAQSCWVYYVCNLWDSNRLQHYCKNYCRAGVFLMSRGVKTTFLWEPVSVGGFGGNTIIFLRVECANALGCVWVEYKRLTYTSTGTAIAQSVELLGYGFGNKCIGVQSRVVTGDIFCSPKFLDWL
jgi:hypothetical protein